MGLVPIPCPSVPADFGAHEVKAPRADSRQREPPRGVVPVVPVVADIHADAAAEDGDHGGQPARRGGVCGGAGGVKVGSGVWAGGGRQGIGGKGEGGSLNRLCGA